MIKFRDNIYCSIHRASYSEGDQALTIYDTPTNRESFSNVERVEAENFYKILQAMYLDVSGPTIDDKDYAPITFRRGRKQTS